jgi:multiple sugar transport system permease protein
MAVAARGLRQFKRTVPAMIWPFIRAILVAGICFVVIYPTLTQLSTALKDVEDLFDPSVVWVPKTFTNVNFKRAAAGMNYWIALRNTLMVTVVTSVLQLFSCTYIGYGFARFRFRGRGVLFALVLLTMIVPPELIMVPLFLNFRYFNLFGLLGGTGINMIGSMWPYAFTSLTGTGIRNGLFIYLMRQFFRGMPGELEEAAYVDGAGPIRTYFRVMLPNALPVMLIVFIFSFVWMYNDVFFAQMFMPNADLMSRNMVRLPLVIRYEQGPEATLAHNAAIILYLLPLIVLYAWLQRHFVESVERSGIVG